MYIIFTGLSIWINIKKNVLCVWRNFPKPLYLLEQNVVTIFVYHVTPQRLQQVVAELLVLCAGTHCLGK